MVDGQVLANWRNGRPKGILLATDWTARCDRPLDRAVQLAHFWNAWLSVLTVVEEKVEDAERDAIQQRIKAWVLYEMPAVDVRFHIDVAFGDVAAQVLELAARNPVDLIVTGVAHRQGIGEYLLGSAVDELVRSSTVPVLVAKRRARFGYERIMVASDYSECSPASLDVLPAFPRAEVQLVDARVPANGGGEIDRENVIGHATQEVRARMVARTIDGPPIQALPQFAQENRFDLAVVCRHGRNKKAGGVIGNTAAKLIEKLPTDVLVIP